jgi:hypothetical protein
MLSCLAPTVLIESSCLARASCYGPASLSAGAWYQNACCWSIAQLTASSCEPSKGGSTRCLSGERTCGPWHAGEQVASLTHRWSSLRAPAMVSHSDTSTE